jgi:osmotically-inducible protein OsmY
MSAAREPGSAQGPDARGVDTAQIVRDALAWDGRINEANLTVTYGDGVVTLQGVAVSEAQRQEAETVASHVPGVRRVVNQILVVNQVVNDD